ncbi:MAG: hypothetical protein KJ714_10115 [Euryarchaeota archaeon]|nr:hypothetical protein [Euryarchaeota archaeon]
MIKPKVIKSEAEYQEALAHLEALMDAQPGTPEEEELELFAVLIEKYEQEHFPIGLPDPVEAIKFRMDQLGLTRKDLIPYIGSQSKVSEVLNGKRPLSLSMIRALQQGLEIPIEVLLQEQGKCLESPKYDLRAYSLQEKGYSISESRPNEYALLVEKSGKETKSNSQPEKQETTTTHEKTLERLCLAVGLNLSECGICDTVFTNWYKLEMEQVFDLYRNGEKSDALQHLFFLERTVRTHSNNSPLLSTLADLMMRIKQLMEHTTEKTRPKTIGLEPIDSIDAHQISLLFSQPDYISTFAYQESTNEESKRKASMGDLFEKMIQEKSKDRGSNG